jgi:basic membrane protein A and related proteins
LTAEQQLRKTLGVGRSCPFQFLQEEKGMKFHVQGRVARVATITGAAALVVATMTAGAGASVKAHTTYKNTLACEVTDTGGINDKSFNASAYAGLTAAGKLSKNITTKVTSSPSTADNSTYQTEINAFVAQHCNVIVTVGFLMSDATWAAAVANPTIHFAQVDNADANPNDCPSYGSPCPGGASLTNFLGLTYNTQEDAFLGGYEAAAYAVKNNSSAPKVATYGGMQFSSVTTYMDGFYDGVQYYNSTKKPKHAVTVLGWNEKTQSGTFIGSFNDTATAQSDTAAWLAQGVTTIFPVAGSDGLGTTAAVKTWNASHTLKANVEWVDTDGCVSDASDCNLFLNSVTKGVTSSVTAAIVAQATGAYYGGKNYGGNYVGTLKNGGAAFVQDSSSAMAKTLSSMVLSEVASIKTKIESGAIKVLIGGK